MNSKGESNKIIAKNPLVIGEIKKSFNEGVEIIFDDVFHKYTYSGKEINGVTSYIKKFFKQFDSELVSKSSAKSWDVDQQAVKDLWESNGAISSLFGTAIHNALEHYEDFYLLGRTIASNRGGGDNYALPKHPILRNIIETFVDINPYIGKKVVTEALVSNVELGICGHADRIVILDEDKKICRIGDYKINVDADKISPYDKVLPPFENLPACKLSKYQLQMSIYANMMEMSGWKVEGLDVFVLEDEWRHFPLEVLKVI